MSKPIDPGLYVAPDGTAHYFRDSATSLCERVRYKTAMPRFHCDDNTKTTYTPTNVTACATCQDVNEQYWLSVYPRVDSPQRAEPARN